MPRILTIASMALCVLSVHAQENRPAGRKPTRVEITPRVTEAQSGQQLTFAAIGYDDAGNKLDAKPSAWFATPFDLAYSSDQGVVTFVLPGEVRVGAIINGKQGFIIISVKPSPVARIEIK